MTTPTTPAPLGHAEVFPDGKSYTLVRISRTFYFDTEMSDDFVRQHIGQMSFCRACDDAHGGAQDLPRRCDRLCSVGRGRGEYRMLRTDLIPIFTLEGALA